MSERGQRTVAPLPRRQLLKRKTWLNVRRGLYQSICPADFAFGFDVSNRIQNLYHCPTRNIGGRGWELMLAWPRSYNIKLSRPYRVGETYATLLPTRHTSLSSSAKRRVGRGGEGTPARSGTFFKIQTMGYVSWTRRVWAGCSDKAIQLGAYIPCDRSPW